MRRQLVRQLLQFRTQLIVKSNRAQAALGVRIKKTEDASVLRQRRERHRIKELIGALPLQRVRVSVNVVKRGVSLPADKGRAKQIGRVHWLATLWPQANSHSTPKFLGAP